MAAGEYPATFAGFALHVASPITQVSESTPHRVFREWLRAIPIRYARRRPLHGASGALLAASPNSVSFTRVLDQGEIEQFGQFADRVCSLFGESPSEPRSRTPGG